jgi:hypothetical protein
MPCTELTPVFSSFNVIPAFETLRSRHRVFAARDQADRRAARRAISRHRSRTDLNSIGFISFGIDSSKRS